MTHVLLEQKLIIENDKKPTSLLATCRFYQLILLEEEEIFDISIIYYWTAV